MNRILFVVYLLIFCAGIGLSDAKLYQWVDKDGVEHFSNSIPENPPNSMVETEQEIPYDAQADAEREKQDKKTMEAVNSEEAAMENESKRAEEPAATPATSSPPVIIEEGEHFHDVDENPDAHREETLHDTNRLEESEHKMHPEIRHEREVRHKETH
jgi:hypothetical protein